MNDEYDEFYCLICGPLSPNFQKIPERYEKCLRVSYSTKEKFLSTPHSGTEWAISQTANIGGDIMNPGIKVLPLASVNGLLGGRMSG